MTIYSNGTYSLTAISRRGEKTETQGKWILYAPFLEFTNFPDRGKYGTINLQVMRCGLPLCIVADDQENYFVRRRGL